MWCMGRVRCYLERPRDKIEPSCRECVRVSLNSKKLQNERKDLLNCVGDDIVVC